MFALRTLSLLMLLSVLTYDTTDGRLHGWTGPILGLKLRYGLLWLLKVEKWTRWVR